MGLRLRGLQVAVWTPLDLDIAMASSSTDTGPASGMDERRKKVLTDYRKRLLESRELEGKVKEREYPHGTRRMASTRF